MNSSNLLKFIFGRFFFSLALNAQAMILLWSAYQVRKNPADLALMGLFEGVPHLAGVLFGGTLVDGRNRRLVVRQAVWAAVFTAFFGAAALAHTETPMLRLTVLLAIGLVTGLVRAIYLPGVFALLGEILQGIREREEFNRVMAKASLAFKFAPLAAPVLGGWLLERYDIGFSLLLIAAAILMSSLSFGALALPDGMSGGAAPDRSKFALARQGAEFVLAHPILGRLLFLDFVTVFFGGVIAILPLYCEEILRGGSMLAGFLRAAPASGAILDALLAPVGLKSRSEWSVAVTAAMLFCGLNLLLAVAGTAWVSFLLLFLAGLVDEVGGVARAIRIQADTPVDLKGRVGAIQSLFAGASNELGAVESGIAARIFGLRGSLVFGAAMGIVLITLAARGRLAARARPLGPSGLSQESR